MDKLALEERETIICFNETNEPASVYTCNKTWQKHIEQRLKIKPTYKNDYGGREYYVPKKQIPMPRARRVLSEEEKTRRATRLKSILSKNNPITLAKSEHRKKK